MRILKLAFIPALVLVAACGVPTTGDESQVAQAIGRAGNGNGGGNVPPATPPPGLCDDCNQRNGICYPQPIPGAHNQTQGWAVQCQFACPNACAPGMCISGWNLLPGEAGCDCVAPSQVPIHGPSSAQGAVPCAPTTVDFMTETFRISPAELVLPPGYVAP